MTFSICGSSTGSRGNQLKLTLNRVLNSWRGRRVEAVIPILGACSTPRCGAVLPRHTTACRRGKDTRTDERSVTLR